MQHRTAAVAVLAALAFGGGAAAQSSTPAETYLAYHQSIQTAESWDELMVYAIAANRAESAALSADEKSENLGLLQLFAGSEENLTIVSEEVDGENAVVTATYCSEGQQGRTEVKMQLEDGVWRIVESASVTAKEPCSG